MITARQGCPLLVGIGDGENFIASDVSAVLSVTRKVIYLEDGDVAEVKASGVTIWDETDTKIERQVHVSDVSLASLELGPYTHFMQKEIHEQPRALTDTIEALIDDAIFSPALFGQHAEAVFKQVDSVLILAAGTSYYAGLTAKYWLESIAKIPTNVEIASEYRYRSSIANPNQLIVTISQSGETLDTMEALKHAQRLGQDFSLSICNVQESALPRASKLVLYTRAGAEIGVASTKAFTAQLTVLTLIALALGYEKGTISQSKFQRTLLELEQIPKKIEAVLKTDEQVKYIASIYKDVSNMLYLGRGVNFPVALEGALKLKEISYIHAEGYPAAEMKHGPIALIDEEMPVIVIATKDKSYEKIVSNIQEVKARGGQVIAIVTEGDTQVKEMANHIIEIPETADILVPFLAVVPLQLLSYHIAVMRECNVDQPRNLAKSVTVE